MEAIEIKVQSIIESTRQSAARVAAVAQKLEQSNFESNETHVSKSLLEQTVFMIGQLLEIITEAKYETVFVVGARTEIKRIMSGQNDNFLILKENLDQAEKLLRETAHKLSWNTPKELKDQIFMMMIQEVHASALKVRYALNQVKK